MKLRAAVHDAVRDRGERLRVDRLEALDPLGALVRRNDVDLQARRARVDEEDAVCRAQ
ncbi:MAG TPA: hypothetical protein VFW80_06630 [Gaiellaceae bacterium]|nr:hypothetical protein [Gaiellaceae bacterium]